MRCTIYVKAVFLNFFGQRARQPTGHCHTSRRAYKCCVTARASADAVSELRLTGQTLFSRFHVTCTRCADRETAPHLNGSGDQCRYTDASLPVAATQSGPEASDARDWRPPGNSGKMNLRCAERRLDWFLDLLFPPNIVDLKLEPLIPGTRDP